MRKLFLFLVVVFAFTQTRAQYIHKIKADSVLITNDPCTAELNLENSTKHIKGFLYNRGNGRTEFRKAVKLNDSTFVFGDDTLLLGGSGKNFANADLTLTGNRRHTIGDDTLNLIAAVGDDSTKFTQNAKAITITGNLAGWNFGSLFNVNVYGFKNNGIETNVLGGTGTGIVARNLTYGGEAISAYSNGIGIYGTSNDNSAGYGLLNGHAIIANYFGPNPHGAGLGVYRSSTEGINAVRPMIRMLNSPQVYAGNAVGIGSSIRWEFPSYANNGASTMFHGTAELYARMTNLRGATTTSEIGFNAMGDSTIRTIMTLDGHGNIILPNYSGTNWQVTDTSGYKALVVDNAGNVRKFNSWPGGSSSLNLQQVTTNGNTTSNFINADAGYYQKGITLLHATDSMLRVGYNAGIANTTGVGNTAIGNGTLKANTTGGGNTAVGYNALTSNTATSRNVAVGTNALKLNTSNDNTALGWAALSANTNGFVNTAVGSTALLNNTTGADNTAVGSSALRENTTGHFNNAIGAGALLVSNGIGNNAMGWSAMSQTGTGNYNVAIGDSVLWFNTTGSGNTAIGANAGFNITTGSRNIAIGQKAYVPSATGSNQLSIGNLIYGTGLDGINTNVSNGKIGIKTQAPAYELDVNGKLGVRTIDSTSNAANVLYQDPATGEIKKAGKQSFAQTATATVASTNSELSLVSTGTGSLTIPASAWFVGKTFRISVRGVYSTSASNPAGVTIKIKLGSTVIAQSAMFLGTGKTDAAYEMRIDLTCRAAGASGSLYTMGMFYNDDDGHSRIDNGTAATSINLSSSQTLDITATPTDDAAGNSFTAFIVTLEAIN